MKRSAARRTNAPSDLLKSFPLYPEIDLAFLVEHFGK